ncbi:MAG: glycosyltransferase family 4 protein [Candidatus Omnitrophica bacterium]|nr:glycosyltransferase family 4 protein [Candidatus Omnitrophota bacterium]
MNILQIVSSLEEISGPANSLYLVATGLAQLGHKVICVHYVGRQGPLVQRLEQQGIKVINLNPQLQGSSKINHLKMLFKLIEIVWKHKIEVIHAHNWDADCYAFLTAFFKKLRVVVTLHSRSYFQWVNSHKLKYERLFFGKATYFVCVSEVMANEFKQITKVPKTKVKVVYNSPLSIFFNSSDPESIKKIRREFNVDDSEFLLGSVGNFTEFKGIIYLLEALAELKNNRCKLLLVGADVANLKPEFDKFLKEKTISDQVIFAGFRQDIPDILDAIDLFVFPSTEEADPIALSEAMARAKPVIATKIGGIPEKVIDGKIGILIDPANSAQIKTAIEYCLNNKDKAIAMGQAAKQVMVDKFSFNAMIKNYEEVYKR